MDDTTHDTHLIPMAITLCPQYFIMSYLHGYYSCFDVLEHQKKPSLLDKNVISA